MTFKVQMLFYWAVFSICIEDIQLLFNSQDVQQTMIGEWKDNSCEDSEEEKTDDSNKEHKKDKDENIADPDYLLMMGQQAVYAVIHDHNTLPSGFIQELEAPPPEV